MTIDRRSLLLGSSTIAVLGISEFPISALAVSGAARSMERVHHIGGLFFRSRDPKNPAKWYQRHLALTPRQPTTISRLGTTQRDRQFLVHFQCTPHTLGRNSKTGW
jgi:hypothetical protein